MKDYKKFFTDSIKMSEGFTYTRYNDGELDLIFKKNPGFSHILNIWGYEIESQSKILGNILSNKIDYYIGLCPGYVKNRSDLLESLIHQDTKVVPSNLFEITNLNDLKKLIEMLKGRNTILVGPDYLQKMEFKKIHIETPIEYVWNHIESITYDIEKTIKKIENPVILYSCSIAANIIADVIFKKFNLSVTQIDMGSTFDPFCGVYSRTGHDKIMKINNIDIDRNLKKEIYQKKRI
jgi:hypothetical protein